MTTSLRSSSMMLEENLGTRAEDCWITGWGFIGWLLFRKLDVKEAGFN